VEKAKSGRRADQDLQEEFEAAKAKIADFEGFCRSLDSSPAVVALAWLLHQPAVTAPIIGPRTTDQLTGSARALDLKLDDEALTRLDEIWPGPGGPAPEAYAW
jgi:aryl-alcohol dehydrogenase-like predicted oxidoreductase